MSASQRVQREFGRCGHASPVGSSSRANGSLPSTRIVGEPRKPVASASSDVFTMRRCRSMLPSSASVRSRSSAIFQCGQPSKRAALVAEPARTPSGYREHYEPAICERVTFIRHAQTAGFTLEQIRQVLEISDSGDAPCEHVVALITDRLSDVDARTAELTQARRHLERLAKKSSEAGSRGLRWLLLDPRPSHRGGVIGAAFSSDSHKRLRPGLAQHAPRLVGRGGIPHSARWGMLCKQGVVGSSPIVSTHPRGSCPTRAVPSSTFRFRSE